MIEVKPMKIISSNTAYIVQNYKIVSEIVSKIKSILENSKIIIPDSFPLEISHHYGIDQFSKYGCTTINLINRAYCKKIIVLFPGQKNPTHMHDIKEETFHVLNGSMILNVNGNNYNLNAGELFTIERRISHSFYSEHGCVFEEISTTHNATDSYYEDKTIAQKQLTERKTLVAHWKS